MSVYRAAGMGPLIGITTRLRDLPSSAGTSPTHTLNKAYTLAVERAGGVPVLLTSQDPASAPAILDRLDGVILSGGGDIDPVNYSGNAAEASLYGIESERDAFEFAIIRGAQSRKLPLLAICRGMQVVNVALGGSLHEDIQSHIEGSSDHFLSGEDVYRTPIHVTIDGDCRLGKLLNTTEVAVNSIHHQSVKELAPGLSAVGWGNDGVVEAVEHEDPEWAFQGVQWHPEFLSEKGDLAALAIFEAFIETASNASSKPA